MPYMYILRCSDGSYYTGSTVDIERRLAQGQATRSTASQHGTPSATGRWLSHVEKGRVEATLRWLYPSLRLHCRTDRPQRPVVG